MSRHANKLFSVRLGKESIKTMSIALHFLQKIGKEVSLEVEEKIFTLRSLNSTKSAFSSVELTQDFFDDYFIAEDIGSSTKSFTGQLSVKLLCTIFRNMKNVISLNISAIQQLSNHELIFEFILNNGIKRIHKFQYQDCEIMNAVFNNGEDTAVSSMQASPKVFIQLLDHIHQSHEVLIEVAPGRFIIKSFHKERQQSNTPRKLSSLSSSSVMKTGLIVSIQEFDKFELFSDENEEFIFCLKEFNSFLALCDAIEGTYFTFYFTNAGSPIKLICRIQEVTIDLIMATIRSSSYDNSNGGADADAKDNGNYDENYKINNNNNENNSKNNIKGNKNKKEKNVRLMTDEGMKSKWKLFLDEREEDD
eukprot:gene6974-9534_t